MYLNTGRLPPTPTAGMAFTFHRVGFQSTAEIHHSPVVDVDLVYCITWTELHQLPQVHHCAAKLPFTALKNRVGRQGVFCWVRHFACCYQAPQQRKCEISLPLIRVSRFSSSLLTSFFSESPDANKTDYILYRKLQSSSLWSKSFCVYEAWQPKEEEDRGTECKPDHVLRWLVSPGGDGSSCPG